MRSSSRAWPRAAARRAMRSMRSRRGGSGRASMRCASGWWIGSATMRMRCRRRRARAASRPGYGVRRIEPELSWAQQLLLQLRSTGERDARAHRLGCTSGSACAGCSAWRRCDRELTRWARWSGREPDLRLLLLHASSSGALSAAAQPAASSRRQLAPARSRPKSEPGTVRTCAARCSGSRSLESAGRVAQARVVADHQHRVEPVRCSDAGLQQHLGAFPDRAPARSAGPRPNRAGRRR